LREVELRDGSVVVESLSPVWKLPALEHLTVACSVDELGPIETETLRELRCFQLDGQALPRLTRAHWPRLESLELRAEMVWSDRDRLVQLLAREQPPLRRLTLAIDGLRPARLVATVAESPLLRSLESLTLGEASDATVAALVDARAMFAHLHELVVQGGTAISPEAAARLRAALPSARLEIGAE
jgi:hypothetical protein